MIKYCQHCCEKFYNSNVCKCFWKVESWPRLCDVKSLTQDKPVVSILQYNNLPEYVFESLFDENKRRNKARKKKHKKMKAILLLELRGHVTQVNVEEVNTLDLNIEFKSKKSSIRNYMFEKHSDEMVLFQPSRGKRVSGRVKDLALRFFRDDSRCPTKSWSHKNLNYKLGWLACY